MIQKFFRKFLSLDKEKEKVLSQAKEQAKEIVLKAQQEAQEVMREALELERHLAKKEQQLELKEESLATEKNKIERFKEEIGRLRNDLERKKEELLAKLEKVAKMSKDDARGVLLNAWEDKLKNEIATMIKAADEEIKKNADERAKEILFDAMRFGATDHVAEYTLSVVNLPSDDFKGRIIGKEGRNIRAFELATGVDVDLEEEGVIKLSSFDAVKREIARVSLDRLIKDGRIQPKRIDEIVEKTKEDIEKVMFQAGDELAHKVGIFNLPSEIVALLGRFKYRYSFGQNMIAHTLEETRIGIALAHELKADVNVVKLGCLLHDIGKVITDKEGSHVQLGVELLKKHHFPQKVVDCVAAHHEDIPFPSVEAVIVYIADVVSGGRPGARHEDFQEYLKRIKTIEDLAKAKKGVHDAFALQAGRELRVIVKPIEISDDEAVILAQKLKEELEKKFDVFPGQIKITVIREFRAEQTTEI
jgi:ribonuclease Y